MKETLKKKNNGCTETGIVVLPVKHDNGLYAWLYSGEKITSTEYIKQAGIVDRIVKLPRIHALFNNYMREHGVPVSYSEDELKFSYAALMSGKFKWRPSFFGGMDRYTDVIVDPTTVMLQIKKEDLANRVTVEQFFKKTYLEVKKTDNVLLFKKGKKNGVLMSLTKVIKQYRHAKINCYLSANENTREQFKHIIVL